MKLRILTLVVLLPTFASLAQGNVAPTPVVNSVAMRAGTTWLDVDFRVNDPDDATVQVRVLAFIDGVRSFAKVIKPVSFVEGTASVLGDAVATNRNHRLTWDVGADWATDVGQLKFEVLALDGRGLVAFDWISIPAAGGQPALTISKDMPATAKVLDALFWDYAGPTPHGTLVSGTYVGGSASGVYAGITLANGTTVAAETPGFVLKLMNLDPATPAEVTYANVAARAGLLNPAGWHAADRPYAGGITQFVGWGANSQGQLGNIGTPTTWGSLRAIDGGGEFTLGLTSAGTILAWGYNYVGQINVPAGLTGVTAIAAGQSFSLALKSDGTVVGWGYNQFGELTIPANLTGVTAISAGRYHSVALKSDGSVVVWGYNASGQSTVPVGLGGVTAISAGVDHTLALRNDGTVVAWGANQFGQCTVPANLTGVTAVAGGDRHSLALKSNGTVVAWGDNTLGQLSVPAGLNGVVAIASGGYHCLALKSDGTVVAWGHNTSGQTNVPAGLTGVVSIAAGGSFSVVLKAEAP